MISEKEKSVAAVCLEVKMKGPYFLRNHNAIGETIRSPGNSCEKKRAGKTMPTLLEKSRRKN